MSSSTVSNWGPPDPKHLVLIDEQTGEEIGRCSGFEWTNVADADGLPATGAKISFDHNTKIKEVKGPVKKIGFAQEYVGSTSAAQKRRIEILETQLQSEYETSRERLEEQVRLEQRLVSILRMLGGAVSITDFEMAEAGNFVVEENWSPANGTILTLVERA
jgi:hypothetical protein